MGLTAGVPDTPRTAGVPAADRTATVPCAPGAGVADDAGIGAVVPSSATVMVLIQVNWSGTPTIKKLSCIPYKHDHNNCLESFDNTPLNEKLEIPFPGERALYEIGEFLP